MEELTHETLQKYDPNYPIQSPITRLTKTHGCQKISGTHMVDISDWANGDVIIKAIYEPYADELLNKLAAYEDMAKSIKSYLIDRSLLTAEGLSTLLTEVALFSAKAVRYELEDIASLLFKLANDLKSMDNTGIPSASRDTIVQVMNSLEVTGNEIRNIVEIQNSSDVPTLKRPYTWMILDPETAN